MTHRHLHPILLLLALLLAVNASPKPTLAEPAAIVNPPAVMPLDSSPFGLNTHLATRYPELDTIDVPAEAVLQSGAGWAREDVHWYRIEPEPGVWDWSYTDAAFRALLRRNIKIVGVLGHPPGWATPYASDAPSEHSFYAPEPQRFAAFAQEVVRRYGQYVHHWEIWNEPDHPHFWKPTPDPAAYAALLIQTSAAIRGIDPQAQILLGGLNPFDTDYLRRVAESGAWSSFDILAIHPYVDPARPEAGVIGAAADGVRALLARFGHKPIWVTEIGWASGPSDRDPAGSADEQAQANYLVRAMLLLWRAGIERVFWYTLKDDPGNPYGLVAFGAGRDDFQTRKPAFYAFRTLSRVLGGARFVGMNDLFTRMTVHGFETTAGWYRGDQPYGMIEGARSPGRDSRAAALRYTFPRTGQNFVAFLRDNPIPIPGQPYAIGLWVYGDGSAKTLKIWLRDARGEVLQYSLGRIGVPGWQFLSAPVGGPVAEWNRLTKSGDGRAQFPAGLVALVIDNAPDGAAGSGVAYIDDLTIISGPEAYDVQLQQGNIAIDVVWSPEPVRARLPTSSRSAELISRDQAVRRIAATDGTLTLDLGPEPIYVRHRR